MPESRRGLNIVSYEDDPNFLLQFSFSGGGGDEIYLRQEHLKAGEVHELQQKYEAEHPGEIVTVSGWVRQWEELSYHEHMDPDEFLIMNWP